MEASNPGKMIAAAFVVPLVVLPLLYPSAFAATPVAGTAPSASHADNSKCPDPTLQGASCQTPVAYGPCLVLLFDNGIREFNCDALERHSFPGGLDTYLSVNDNQTVSEMVQIDGDPRDCPYTRCDTYVVITQFNAVR
ncbi:MAG: hypothetical protein WCO25_05730 [Candidatus Uhrbacteria bacterium]